VGREALAQVTWRGESGETKLLLEAGELILRGAIKARIARAVIWDVRTDADGLRLSADGELLHAVLSEAEAMRWAKAILTPPPSLASKLGIGPDKPALVQGAIDDAVLTQALTGATTEEAGAACVIVALIDSHSALDFALARASATQLPLWCVYAKGKATDPGDGAIRTVLRRAGMMDNKTSAVSERLTATRYGWPKS
jgi:hypothetical protein